jgi:LysM repeat protein
MPGKVIKISSLQRRQSVAEGKYYYMVLTFLCSFFISTSWSQTNIRPDYSAYISAYRNIAIREMLIYHIPASITLAQGIIESSCGKSPLATEANNHFGIKCHQDWTGDTFYYDDDAKQECFRKYASAEESFRDHSLFLVNRKRYAALFSLDSDDYTGWAMGLKQSGYATNPQYPTILINLIESAQLNTYDTCTSTIDSILLDEVRQEPVYLENKVAKKHIYNSKGTLIFHKDYQMPDPMNYEEIKISSKGRRVFRNNGVPFIFAQNGDSWYSIAIEFRIYAAQVYSYNELTADDSIVSGQILYIEPKKNSATIKEYKVKKTDTLYSISQEFGVKSKAIIKYNALISSELPTGTILQIAKPSHLFF